jgi:hypothetical protein
MKITLEALNKLPPDIRKEFIQTALKAKEKRKKEKVQIDFLTFVKSICPEFVEGYHHKKIAEKFNDLAKGKIKRLIINMPPRHTNLSLLRSCCQHG